MVQPNECCGVGLRKKHVKHLTSLTGVLTVDITINQNCKFRTGS